MFRFLPEITDLVLDEREVESPGQLVLVGLDASDEVRVLAAQVVDQSPEGDLELGSGCCRSTPSRSPGVAWNRKLKIIGLGSGFAEARFLRHGFDSSKLWSETISSNFLFIEF